MQAYKFETKVLPSGVILLPKEYSNLKSRTVEVIILEKDIKKIKEDESTKLFWESFGCWKDDRTAEEIIKDIYESRKSSKRDIIL